MFEVYCIILCVLAYVMGDLYSSIIKDCVNFYCCQRVDSSLRVQDTLAATVDSFEPEFVEHPNSLWTPAFAIAIPGLALLACLAFAVYWKCRPYRPKLHEVEDEVELEYDVEMDLEDSEDDLETYRSEVSTLEYNEDDLEMQMSEVSRLEDCLDFEEPDYSEDDLETDTSEVPRLEDYPELEDSDEDLETDTSEVPSLEDDQELEDGEHDLEMDTREVSRLEYRLKQEELENERAEVERQRLEEALETSQATAGNMERLWKEAKEEIVWLRNQLAEKDVLLRKYADQEAELNECLRKEKADNRILQDALHHGKEMEISLEEEKKRGNEMEASLITLKVELEHKDLQIESLLNTERKLICEREGLEDKLGVALNRGKELDSLLEEADNRARKVASYFEKEVQRREKQICDLLSQEEQLEGQVITLNRANERWQRELQEKRKDEEDLREEKKQLENQVENLSNERNDLRREMEERSGQYQLLLQEKAREQLEMKEHYEEILKQKDHEIEKLREGEDELKQLRQECEMLKEKCRKQEENMIREEQGFRERQRRLEEALRTQDKYMLMTLLHGTAQRNFHLQHIALQYENEVLDNKSEKEEEQDKFAEPTTRKENEGQEEDPCELLRMRKEKQHRKYCDAQRERTNYGKQWEVLTQTLTDVIHGDERIPEATMGDGNKNSGVTSKSSVQNGEEAIPQDTVLGRRSPT